jgi:lysophospholipase L1-like esterase
VAYYNRLDFYAKWLPIFAPNEFQNIREETFQALITDIGDSFGGAEFLSPNDGFSGFKAVRFISRAHPLADQYSDHFRDELKPLSMFMGTICRVDFGAAGTGREYYELVYDSEPRTPAGSGLHAWRDGHTAPPTPQVPVKWVVYGSPESLTANVPAYSPNFNSTGRPAGYPVDYTVTAEVDGEEGFYKSRVAGQLPAPTDPVQDANWRRAAPPVATTGLSQRLTQSVAAAMQDDQVLVAGRQYAVELGSGRWVDLVGTENGRFSQYGLLDGTSLGLSESVQVLVDVKLGYVEITGLERVSRTNLLARFADRRPIPGKLYHIFGRTNNGVEVIARFDNVNRWRRGGVTANMLIAREATNQANTATFTYDLGADTLAQTNSTGVTPDDLQVLLNAEVYPFLGVSWAREAILSASAAQQTLNPGEAARLVGGGSFALKMPSSPLTGTVLYGVRVPLGDAPATLTLPGKTLDGLVSVTVRPGQWLVFGLDAGANPNEYRSMVGGSVSLNTPTPTPATTGIHLTLDGNSLTANNQGTYDEALRQAFIALKNAQGDTNLVSFTNLGVGGQTTQQLLDDEAAQVFGCFDATKAHNVLVPWEWFNAFRYSDLVTAPQEYERIKQYCQAAKAAHPTWKIVVPTSPDDKTTYKPTNFDSRREELRQLLLAARARGEAWLDAVADMSLDTRLDMGNATYSTDHFHPLDAGYAILVRRIASAIAQALYGIAQVPALEPEVITPPASLVYQATSWTGLSNATALPNGGITRTVRPGEAAGVGAVMSGPLQAGDDLKASFSCKLYAADGAYRFGCNYDRDTAVTWQYIKACFETDGLGKVRPAGAVFNFSYPGWLPFTDGDDARLDVFRDGSIDFLLNGTVGLHLPAGTLLENGLYPDCNLDAYTDNARLAWTGYYYPRPVPTGL